MAKKSEAILDSNEANIVQYKWEFLRRNKNYIEDYSKRHELSGNYLRRCEFWLKKYGITHPFNPAHSYDKLIKSQKGLDKVYKVFESSIDSVPTIVVSNIFAEPLNFMSVDAQDDLLFNYDKEKLKNIKTLQLEVNLLKKKEAIFKDFKSIILLWKEHILNMPQTKTQWMMYDTYLKIYDLRHPCKGRGKTFLKITEEVYPNDDKRFYVIERKVYRNYKECKRLINGGYRYIE